MQYPSYGPSGSQTSGPDLGYAMDTMGRLNTMTDLAANASILSGTTYGPSNELLTISGAYNTFSESRTYNSMLQLTQLANNGVNITYGYPSTQNNGKIASQTDNISGEQVVYTYDALNRLASAAATSGSWGQSYSYDGFGNLLDQNVTAGSAPGYSATVNPATNQRTSPNDCADANGNSGAVYPCTSTPYFYDVENRLVTQSGGNFQYSYAPGNKRVWRGLWSGTLTTDEVTFWSVSGQKLATYQLSITGGVVNNSTSAPVLVATQTGTNYYFGRKLIKNAGGYVGADRLGSIGKFYPYGQEKPSATTNGTEKFTGYFRDAETGLDYADQRYHNPGTGTFLTPDPYIASGGSANPASWNKYAYTMGDPINGRDPRGLYTEYDGADTTDYGGGGNTCVVSKSDDTDPEDQCYGDTGATGSSGTTVCGANQFLSSSGSCGDDGTGDAPSPTPCSDWGCMPAAYQAALTALTQNTACMDLFGNAKTRAGKWNPVTVLTSLFQAQSGTYGSVNFGYTGNGSALTTPNGFLLPNINQGLTGTSATISINSTYWNDNNVAFNAETLLHEMGHLYNFVRGSGGFALPNKAELKNASAFDTLIDQKCNLNP